MKLKVRYSSVT